MATNEIKITVDTSSVALDLLDAEIIVAAARFDAAAAALELLRARRKQLQGSPMAVTA